MNTAGEAGLHGCLGDGVVDPSILTVEVAAPMIRCETPAIWPDSFWWLLKATSYPPDPV